MRFFAPKIIGLATAMLIFCFAIIPFANLGTRTVDLYPAAGLAALSSMVAMFVHGLIYRALEPEPEKPSGLRRL
jgi:hypothetical protein